MQLDIFSSLKDSPLSLGILFEHCRGQGYDGASNFQGHVSGVAKRFEDEIHLLFLYIVINLCVQDTAR